MAKDSSLPVRRAVVAQWKAAPEVSEIVDDRVYGPKPPTGPTWPFVRYGVPTTTPFRATCLDGSKISFIGHAFAKGEDESACSDLCAALASSLDGFTIPLEASYAAKLTDVRWTGTQILPDLDEAAGWHGLVSFEAKVTS